MDSEEKTFRAKNLVALNAAFGDLRDEVKRDLKQFRLERDGGWDFKNRLDRLEGEFILHKQESYVDEEEDEDGDLEESVEFLKLKLDNVLGAIRNALSTEGTSKKKLKMLAEELDEIADEDEDDN